MQVSIVITTKNEEKNIGNCLNSIRQQAFSVGEIEIIVVDNNSTDKTKEIALSYTDKVFNQRLAPLNLKVFNWGPERSAQRNYGIMEKAAGKYALYLDADMILSPQVVAECVAELEKNSKIVAMYVSEIVMGDSFWSQVRRFERGFYDGTVVDAARFMRRDAFIKTGGFDENLYACEDWDLNKKLRQIGMIGLIKAPIFHNETEFDLRKYLVKKGYYAQSFDKYIARWGRYDSDIQKQMGAGYRFLGVFMENGKWKKLLSHPVLTAGMYFLRFLVGLSYILRKSN